jgi:phage terminase large subunit
MLAAILFPGIWIMIIRKSYQEVMKNYFFKMRSIYPPKAFKYKPLKSDKYFDFSNGSKIFFMQCSNTDDADKIKGIECQLMIVDEANEIDETTLMMLFGSVRNSSIKDFIPTKIMTGNPGGESDQWFLDHFVEVDYSKWRPEEIKNKDKFVYIPATVYDNKHVNEEYIEYLKTLPTELREAWLNGNWHVTQGQFFSEWRDDIHVVPTFKVPDNWVRSFGFDAGYSKEHNSIGLWVAQNPDTEELFVYREYAGTITEQCVKDIIRLSEGEHFRQRVCDPAIFIEKKETYVTQSAGRMFMSAGFALTPANNKREIGWMLLKQWLHWSDYKKPMLYVMDCCPKTRLSIPAAKYKRSGKIADINDFVNDDPLDTLRYIIVSGGFSYPVTDLRGNRPKLEVEHKVETPYWAIKREERIRALKYNNSISKASYTRW